MEHNHSISKTKHIHKTIPIILFTVVILLCIALINPIQVHAEQNAIETIANKVATSFVNSNSDNAAGGTDVIKNGVLYNRTGYLCYMLTKEGATISGCNAVALKSPNYNGIDGAVWECKSRAGHTVSHWESNKTAADYWNVTPWSEGGYPSNEPTIKSWMSSKTINPTYPNAAQFVTDIWGNDVLQKFISGDYILVIETIMSLQFSKPGDTFTQDQIDKIKKQCLDESTTWINSLSDNAVTAEVGNYPEYQNIDNPAIARKLLLAIYAKEVAKKATDIIESKLNPSGGRTYLGDPVIGTVPNLLVYDKWNTTVFDSYLNKVAPHAEKIATSEAGFTAYIGGVNKLTDKEVMTYGVGMLIVHCSDTPLAVADGLIHTYWEPNGTPGDTEPPSKDNGTTGSCTIVKRYFTNVYNESNELISSTCDGTFVTEKATNKIQVMNEEGYELVGWKALNKVNKSYTPNTWDKLSKIRSGNTSTTLELDIKNKKSTKRENVLVLLFVKEDTSAVPDYIISESRITKRVAFSNSLTGKTEKLNTKVFTWTAPAVAARCASTTGHLICTKHVHTDSCAYGCGKEAHIHTDGCYKGKLVCTITDTSHEHKAKTCYELSCTKEEHIHDRAKDKCYYGCVDPDSTHVHSQANGCYDKCTASWTDNSIAVGLSMSISNVSKSVVASKVYDSVNGINKNIISPTTIFQSRGDLRTGIEADTQNFTGFDASVVLYRGNDKLTLAKWKNTAGYTNATNFLTSSGNFAAPFKSANKPNGTRYSGESYLKTFAATFAQRASGTGRDVTTNYTSSVKRDDNVMIKGCADEVSNYTSTSTYSLSSIIVKTQVYWGKSEIEQSSDYSSTLEAGTVTFYPYIAMQYDDKTLNRVAYVMGEFKRTATFYDYAEVNISGSAYNGIAINSSQWSTYSDAKTGFTKAFKNAGGSESKITNEMLSSILPGGATYGISIPSEKIREVTVTSVQAYMPKKSSGLIQITNTGGTVTGLKNDTKTAKEQHKDFAEQVRAAFDDVDIVQYVSNSSSALKSTNPEKVFEKGIEVEAGASFGGKTLSSDKKYYLNSGSNRVTLDVTDLSATSFATYTFFSHTNGNIYCRKNKTTVPSTVALPDDSSIILVAIKGSNEVICSDTTVKNIAEKTGVVKQLRDALLTNVGNDTEAPWATIDGHWYNEAFDGVTYLYQESTFYIGLWNTPEYQAVLDVKLVPDQTAVADIFEKYNTSAFRTDKNLNKNVIGIFTNANKKSKTFDYDMRTLYYSKVFYIPNATTQDLK